MNREEWLARRNSPPMGRLLRKRERYIFVSSPLILVDKDMATEHYEVSKVGKSTYYNGKTLVSTGHYPVIKGRNQRKRNHRATKSARKYWSKVS